MGVFNGHIQFHGNKRSEARRIQHPGHSYNSFFGKAAGIKSHMTHGIQRIADNDEYGFRRTGCHFLSDTFDNAGIGADKIITAHPRLSRNTGCDNDNIRSGRIFITVGSGEMGIMFFYGSRLIQIQGFALGYAFDDVHQNNITQLLFSQSLGRSRPNISSADYGNFFIHDNFLPNLKY